MGHKITLGNGEGKLATSVGGQLMIATDKNSGVKEPILLSEGRVGDAFSMSSDGLLYAVQSYEPATISTTIGTQAKMDSGVTNYIKGSNELTGPDWTLYAGPTIQEIAQPTPISGVSSCFVLSAVQSLTPNDSVLQNAVSVDPNTTYTLSIYTRTVGATKGTIFCYDSSINKITESKDIIADGAWHRTSITYTTKDTTDTLLFYVGNSDGYMQVFQGQVEKGTEATDPVFTPEGSTGSRLPSTKSSTPNIEEFINSPTSSLGLTSRIFNSEDNSTISISNEAGDRKIQLEWATGEDNTVEISAQGPSGSSSITFGVNRAEFTLYEIQWGSGYLYAYVNGLTVVKEPLSDFNAGDLTKISLHKAGAEEDFFSGIIDNLYLDDVILGNSLEEVEYTNMLESGKYEHLDLEGSTLTILGDSTGSIENSLGGSKPVEVGEHYTVSGISDIVDLTAVSLSSVVGWDSNSSGMISLSDGTNNNKLEIAGGWDTEFSDSIIFTAAGHGGTVSKTITVQDRNTPSKVEIIATTEDVSMYVENVLVARIDVSLGLDPMGRVSALRANHETTPGPYLQGTIENIKVGPGINTTFTTWEEITSSLSGGFKIF